MENYDPNKPVCDNQDDFNQALQAGIKYNRQENVKKMQPWMLVYSVIYLIFFIWAIILALKVPEGPDKILHLVFAILVSPVYVISYYIGGSRVAN